MPSWWFKCLISWLVCRRTRTGIYSMLLSVISFSSKESSRFWLITGVRRKCFA